MPKTVKDKVHRPVHEVRLGRIRAAIWENQTENNGTRHNVVFSRLYKDDQNEWRDSTSFGRDDLPLVAKVADQVHTWIFEHAKPSGANGDAASGASQAAAPAGSDDFGPDVHY